MAILKKNDGDFIRPIADFCFRCCCYYSTNATNIRNYSFVMIYIRDVNGRSIVEKDFIITFVLALIMENAIALHDEKK